MCCPTHGPLALCNIYSEPMCVHPYSTPIEVNEGGLYNLLFRVGYWALASSILYRSEMIDIIYYITSEFIPARIILILTISNEEMRPDN